MKKIVITLSLIILVLGYLYLNQCSRVKDLKKDLEISYNQVPDTIWKTDSINIPVPYPVKQEPEIVYKYIKENKPSFELVLLEPNDIKLLNVGRDSMLVSKKFLTTFPLNEKLLFLGLTKTKLNLSTMNIHGDVLSQVYNIDLDKYNYSYQLQQLTNQRKTKWSIKPYASYDFRIRNNLHDINLGIKLNTNRFNYEVGINGYYYPSIIPNPNWDIKFGITYNFN